VIAMPPNETRTHYERLLAPIYRWMLGDFEAALERSRKELEAIGIGPAKPGARGLDLGAGNGLQTIPLIDAGYAMTAVDSSKELLGELLVERPMANVVVGDLLQTEELLRGNYDVIVCMGDTLTHLDSKKDVDRLLAVACRRLAPGGTLALTFRDYVSSTRESTDRFVPVRSDSNRILTCCLDYGADRVEVTDLVHERRVDAWELRASAYTKLRLSREWVAQQATVHGLTVSRSEVNAGRVTIVGYRLS
jgi:SAM-dependent methyltransferase